MRGEEGGYPGSWGREGPPKLVGGVVGGRG